MSFLRDIVYSLHMLAGAKSRTFLTMLGIIIGVMSVLAVSSIGLSAQELVTSQVSNLGSNLIGVLPGGSSDTGPPPIAFGIVTTTLKREDAVALENIPHVLAVTPYVRATEPVVLGRNSTVTSINGVSEQYPGVEDVTVGEGRFFGPGDVAGLSRVVVVGFTVAEKLSPGTSIIGKDLRIKNGNYRVIGVLAKRGTAAFQDQDDQVLIPVTTAQKFVVGINYVNFIRTKIDAPENIAAAKEDIRRTLRRRHGISDPAKDDFSVRGTDQALSILGNVTGALKGFFVAVVAISLVVGGINIMNIMYVAVRERTSEIGLRKALGARRGRILSQFLIESAVISLGGGILGVILGILLTLLISLVVNALGYVWHLFLPISSAVMALGISAGIGIIFGMAPAIAASRLEAIQALRYE